MATKSAMRAVAGLGSLMDWPGQFFIDSSCCFLEWQAPAVPEVSSSMCSMLNCC